MSRKFKGKSRKLRLNRSKRNMHHNQFSFLILTGFLIVLIYQEIQLIKLYRFYKKNGKSALGKIIKIFQTPDSNPIYKVKIESLNLAYSKHRIKIIILSSLFPLFLRKNFKVYYLNDSDYCMVATPLMIILDWVFVCLIILLLSKLM